MNMREERRRYPRLAISFPVECDLCTGNSYFYTVTKDISLTGIRIVANTFLPRNYPLKIKINLINRVLQLRAKVAWCNQMRASERYSAGLEFMEPTPRQEQDISCFLNKVDQVSAQQYSSVI
jgi:c-di-GMP-binding flagellar brake protein YcgR